MAIAVEHSGLHNRWRMMTDISDEYFKENQEKNKVRK